MHGYLREYLALKGVPLLAVDGEAGAIASIRFREPGWNAISVLAAFGRPRWLMPAALVYSQQDPPLIHVQSGEGVTESGYLAASAASIVAVDADSLRGRAVLSSSDDEVGGRVHDLLIDVRAWYLAYVIVHNGRHRVLLHASWVTGLSADDAALMVDGPHARSLHTAPEYRGVSDLTPRFLDALHHHYT